MSFDFQGLSAWLESYIKEKGLPGVSVTIRGPQGVLYERGFGYRSEDRSLIPDGDTIFGIASMSKSMTTLCCAILQTEGKLNFSDPVSDYFPAFRVPGTPKECVTLRHLAMHTAGIPPIPPLEWSIAKNSVERDSEIIRQLRESSPNKMDKIEDIVEYISISGDYAPLGAPGEYMSYCNEGYAILSYVVDQAAGMPLEEFLRQRLFEPLGMTRTVLDLDGSEARALAGGNMTSLFEKGEDGKLVCDDNWSVLPPYRGCACVKSTSSDMAKYYQMLSQKGMFAGRQIVDPEAVEILIGREFPETEKAFYCFGLSKRIKNGRVICEHSGGLHGVSTQGGFLGEGYSVVVLCNQGEVDTEPMQWACFNLLLGLPLSESHAWPKPSGRRFSVPEAVTGDYMAKEGIPSHCVVSSDEKGDLFASYSDQELILRHCCGSVFAGFLKNKPEERFTTIEFFIRDGRAWAAACGTRIFQSAE